MRDFNENIGKSRDDDLMVERFGYGQRNPKGQSLANFLEKKGLFMMNSVFQKLGNRKWTGNECWWFN
ncbi:unnamed protein product [Euphydryas editha]|uniref:Uncharacterized protein n=1 Tax=Euphydryas editha TaxID=104508 RepID=A0AAU9TUA4_EUPED|nr:unnamed protein product [Euphydryas editha]